MIGLLIGQLTPGSTDLMSLMTSSGPWAIAFVYAFQLIVKAWQTDRQRLDLVLDRQMTSQQELSSALRELRTSIDSLSSRLDDIEGGHIGHAAKK